MSWSLIVCHDEYEGNVVTYDYVLKDEHQNLAAEVGTRAAQTEVDDLAASHSEAQTEIEKHGTQLMMLESFRATTSGELAERPDAAKFQDIIDSLKLGIRDCEDRQMKFKEESESTCSN